MDMRFGTWNVRSLYRADSMTTVATEMAKHKLYLVCCDIIVMIVHVPEDKIDDMKDSYCKTLNRVFDKSHSFHIKFSLHFNAKECREDVSKQQFGMRVHIKSAMIMK
jgi:hypothetical protein